MGRLHFKLDAGAAGLVEDQIALDTVRERTVEHWHRMRYATLREALPGRRRQVAFDRQE